MFGRIWENFGRNRPCLAIGPNSAEFAKCLTGPGQKMIQVPLEPPKFGQFRAKNDQMRPNLAQAGQTSAEIRPMFCPILPGCEGGGGSKSPKSPIVRRLPRAAEPLWSKSPPSLVNFGRTWSAASHIAPHRQNRTTWRRRWADES